MSDFDELLDLAIEEETSPDYQSVAGKDRRGEVLETTLERWEEEDFVSFASAFRITGNQIKNPSEDQFNPPDLSSIGDEIRGLFGNLTSPPGGKVTEGIWPWNLFRKEIEDDTRDGLFPPQVLHLNQEDESCDERFRECEPLGERIELGVPALDQVEDFEPDDDRISEAFGEAHDGGGEEDGGGRYVERESWRWYAAFASVVGDYVRGQNSPDDFQPSKHLVYILGTRKEFARRPEADYGLIVGFTDEAGLEDEENLKEALNNVLAAWNILAVAPHIMEDARRIEFLEAAQRLTHTFKTYIDATALPAVKKNLRGGSINSEYGKEVTDAVKRISKLTAMMGFVARGSEGQLRSGTDFNDAYDIVKVVKDHFEDQLADKYKCDVSSDIEECKRCGQWVSRFYLRCALSEIITNIEGQETEDTDVEVKLTMEELVNSDGESTSNLKIRVENGMDNEEGDEEREVSGTGAVESFFKALGGGAEFYSTQNDRYVTEAWFNVDEWEERTKDSLKNKDAADGSIEDTGESSDAEVPEIEPRKAENIAFRVLLLDDELGARRNALSSLDEIDQDDEPAEDKWGKYERLLGEEEATFKVLYHMGLKLEVVLCRRLKKAREHLLGDGVHFDVCLADIDFKKDIGYLNRDEPVPRLGGLLFAIGLVDEPKTYTSIFTAKDDLLRDVPDYSYLREMKKHLGNLQFESEGSKEIDKSLKEAFRKWTKTVLLDELHPTPQSSIHVAEHLDSGRRDPRPLELEMERKGIGNTIPSETLYKLLGDSERKQVANMLSRSVCGHALVRQLFCDYAHNPGQRKKGFSDNEKLDVQEKFDDAWKRACKLYDIRNKEELEEELEKDKKESYYRRDLRNIFEAHKVTENGDKVTEELRLFALTEEPDDFWNNIRCAVEGYVVKEGSNAGVEVQSKRICEGNTEYGKQITFSGDRQDNMYLRQIGSGGSFQDVVNALNKTVSEIRLDGPEGSASITPDGKLHRLDESDRSEFVSLTITVRHLPAEEPEDE